LESSSTVLLSVFFACSRVSLGLHLSFWSTASWDSGTHISRRLVVGTYPDSLFVLLLMLFNLLGLILLELGCW
jgi:hypothetical protein